MKNLVVYHLVAMGRGISQIFFVRNAAAGALMLAGISLVHPVIAVALLAGAFFQQATAIMLCYLAPQVYGPGGSDTGRRMIGDGLMGYNGALVGGVVVHLSLLGDPVWRNWAKFSELRLDIDWLTNRVVDVLPSVAFLVVGAALCVPLHVVLKHFLGAIPVATAPFCIVGSLLIAVEGQLLSIPPVLYIDAVENAPGASAFASFGDVEFAATVVAGVLILASLLIFARGIALWAFLGAAAAVAVGFPGYCAALAAAGAGYVFLERCPRRQRTAIAFVAVAGAIFFQELFRVHGLPALTWPFVLSLWIVLLAIRPRPEDVTQGIQ